MLRRGCSAMTPLLWRCTSTMSATALSRGASMRMVLLREMLTDIQLALPQAERPTTTTTSSSSSEAPTEAALKWQYQSSRPTHLVVSVRPAVMHDESMQNVAGDEQDPPQPQGQLHQPQSASKLPVMGRLFLRPYNVAQILTVLLGRTGETKIVREHASLTLTAVAQGSRAPSQCVLRGSFSIKVPSATNEGELIYTNQRCNVSAELEDADIVLLTQHLEAVMANLFGVAHHFNAGRSRYRHGMNASSTSITTTFSNDNNTKKKKTKSEAAPSVSQQPTQQRASQYRSQDVLSSMGHTALNDVPTMDDVFEDDDVELLAEVHDVKKTAAPTPSSADAAASVPPSKPVAAASVVQHVMEPTEKKMDEMVKEEVVEEVEEVEEVIEVEVAVDSPADPAPAATNTQQPVAQPVEEDAPETTTTTTPKEADADDDGLDFSELVDGAEVAKSAKKTKTKAKSARRKKSSKTRAKKSASRSGKKTAPDQTAVLHQV